MTILLDKKDEFLDKVRNKEYFYFYRTDGTYYHDKSMWDFRWDNIIHLLDSHPEDMKKTNKNKNNFNLIGMEKRQSSPEFCKTFMKDLKELFPRNNITSHIFGGIGNHQSFDIHRDAMDVLYLQTIGKVELSIWKEKTPSNQDNITENQGELLIRKKLHPGHLVWIPRGTFHLIEPLESRIAFSFGVEGEPDPSTYV